MPKAVNLLIVPNRQTHSHIPRKLILDSDLTVDQYFQKNFNLKNNLPISKLIGLKPVITYDLIVTYLILLEKKSPTFEEFPFE